MLPFRAITIDDRKAVEQCSTVYNYRLCDHCFTDLFMWRAHYHTEICFLEGFLLVKTRSPRTARIHYLAPIGEGDLASVVAALEQDACERGIPFSMIAVAEPMVARLETACPGKLSFFHHDEDSDDYLYETDKLATLAGKKLQSKRNLVNRFQAAYEGRWQYEDLCTATIGEALDFHKKWCAKNGCAESRDLESEGCAIVQALTNFDVLGLCGGMLRLDGEVIAFTLGCQASPDHYVIQIEKAMHEIAGAYQMINREFVRHHCMEVRYVNREEDMGLEGLRRAKQSYYPALRGVKYTAQPKEG